MKNKAKYCLFSAIALIAVAFCVRQRTLNELWAGNQSLRQQLDGQAQAPAGELTPAVRSATPVVALSSEEHIELLQLRGQLLPLRRELREMSNRVEVLAQPAIQLSSTQPKPLILPEQIDRKAEIQEVNTFMRSEPYRNARSFSIALGEFIKAHNGELPGDLAKVEVSARRPLPQGVSRRFELMRSGTIPQEALSYTLVAREKEPQQLPDGRWRRLYLRADGGTATAGPVAKPNWPVWERNAERDFMRQQARQKQEKPPP